MLRILDPGEGPRLVGDRGRTPWGIDPGQGRNSGDFVSWETIFSRCIWDIEHDNKKFDNVYSLVLGMQVP